MKYKKWLALFSATILLSTSLSQGAHALEQNIEEDKSVFYEIEAYDQPEETENISEEEEARYVGEQEEKVYYYAELPEEKEVIEDELKEEPLVEEVDTAVETPVLQVRNTEIAPVAQEASGYAITASDFNFPVNIDLDYLEDNIMRLANISATGPSSDTVIFDFDFSSLTDDNDDWLPASQRTGKTFPIIISLYSYDGTQLLTTKTINVNFQETSTQYYMFASNFIVESSDVANLSQMVFDLAQVAVFQGGNKVDLSANPDALTYELPPGLSFSQMTAPGGYFILVLTYTPDDPSVEPLQQEITIFVSGSSANGLVALPSSDGQWMAVFYNNQQVPSDYSSTDLQNWFIRENFTIYNVANGQQASNALSLEFNQSDLQNFDNAPAGTSVNIRFSFGMTDNGISALALPATFEGLPTTDERPGSGTVTVAILPEPPQAAPEQPAAPAENQETPPPANKQDLPKTGGGVSNLITSFGAILSSAAGIGLIINKNKKK